MQVYSGVKRVIPVLHIIVFIKKNVQKGAFAQLEILAV